MLLLKSFVRKGKIKIYMLLFVVLFSTLFILNGIGNSVRRELDDINYEQASFVMVAKENHEKLLKKERKVKNYRRALSFEVGKNNEIMYSKSSYEDDISAFKINWDRLIYNENMILAFNSSSCGLGLEKKEVELYLDEKDYDLSYLDNYLGEEIIFKYNEQDISLKIKGIRNPKTFNYICISDSLYNTLKEQEKNNIYDIETVSYKAMEYLSDKWINLESNNFYTSGLQIKIKDTDETKKINILENMIDMFNIIDFTSIVIVVLITIFVIKDLVGDEEKDILLLKEIGFNKRQNMGNSLRNMIVLDIIVFGLSIAVSGGIAFVLNCVCGFNLELFNLECFVYLSLFVIFIEVVFHAMFIRKY